MADQGDQDPAPVNAPPVNPQNIQVEDAELQGVLLASLDWWLTEEQSQVLFTNSDLFQIVNSYLIPVFEDGLYRVDNRYYQDHNVWEHNNYYWFGPSADQEFGFNYSFNVGAIDEEGWRIRRLVIRRQVTYGVVTFVHYRVRNDEDDAFEANAWED